MTSLPIWLTVSAHETGVCLVEDDFKIHREFEPKGAVLHRFTYDAGNQLTNALWKNGTATNANDTFSYDLNGRLTNETQTVVGSSPKSVGYEYDAAGRRTKLVYPDGTFISYQYNANGWLTNIVDGGTGNAIVIYSYDAAGRRTKRQLENNTYTVYDYDNADQMTNIWHCKAVSGVTNTLSRYTYGYDTAGNRTWVKRLNGKGDVFKYDDTDQLTNVLYEATNPDTTPTAATNEVQYVFDAAGNRTSVTSTNTGTTTSYVPNSLNQYTNVGGTTMKYDANGNPTNIVENGVTLSLSYDRENRLITVHNGTITITNTYDAFNRLVERASTNRTRFIYDSQWRVIAEYDGSEMLLGKYVYGPEIDEPVKVTRNSSRFYYHQAALGTVTELTGSQGNVRERYFYDVYGAVRMTDQNTNTVTTSVIGNRFLFQGRDRDPVTGLYNFRNRYYSPTLGRFLQMDPIRHLGGLNFYSFVRNCPNGFTDPHGLIKFKQADPKDSEAACNKRGGKWGPIYETWYAGSLSKCIDEQGSDNDMGVRG